MMPRLGFGAFLAPHHPIGEHPDAAVPPRPRLRRAPRRARLRRVLVRRAPLQRLGDDRLARDVPGRGRRAHQAHQARHRRGLAALPPSVQRGPAHGAARPHDRRPGDLRLRARARCRPTPTRSASTRWSSATARTRRIGVIRRLFSGERVTTKSDWFTLQDAALQLLPLQEDMPFAVASQISPSGMTLAGKYGIGIISIGSMSNEGLHAAADAVGLRRGGRRRSTAQTVDRKNWRVLLSWHIAETREKARERGARRPAAPAQRIHRRHPAAARARSRSRSPDEAVDKTAFVGRRRRDDRHARRSRRSDQVGARQVSGGFGTVRRLRARLGQPREHHAQLGHGGALRRPGDQRLRRRSCASRRSS